MMGVHHLIWIDRIHYLLLMKISIEMLIILMIMIGMKVINKMVRILMMDMSPMDNMIRNNRMITKMVTITLWMTGQMMIEIIIIKQLFI